MKRKYFFLCLIFFLAPLIAGCGYNLVGKGSSVPKNVRTISIPTFTNVSQEPGIEVTFTQVVREEFIRDGRLKVVDSRKADWLLTGEIQGYALSPVSFDSSDNVTAYWIEMALTVKLKDRRNKKDIFEQSFNPHWDYAVTSAVSLSNVSRLQGIENAAKDFGKTLTSLAIEGF